MRGIKFGRRMPGHDCIVTRQKFDEMFGVEAIENNIAAVTLAINFLDPNFDEYQNFEDSLQQETEI